VLRVVPDQRRGECVNIGVVVFKSEGDTDVRMLSSLNKVYALNANIDVEQFEDLPKQITDWVSSTNSVNKKHDALKKFGIVTVSDLGFFECDDKQYDWFVNQIMNTLVKPPAHLPRQKIQGRVRTALRRIFLKQQVLGFSPEDIHKRLIVERYPIAVNENLYADFAFKNGAYHITETINYKVTWGINTDKFEETGLKAIKLDKSKKVFGEDTKLSLVYVADTHMEKQLTPHLNLLGDYADHVVNLRSTADKERYFSALLTHAGRNKSIESRS
jgi:hypothetical protein